MLKFRDEGFMEALENELLGKVILDRLESTDETNWISFDELVTKLGFDPQELRDEAIARQWVELFNSNQRVATNMREEMLYSMDDGSHAILPLKEKLESNGWA